MLTPEQERVKALFAGDPRANFAKFKQQQQGAVNDAISPGTAVNDMRKGAAYTSFVNETPLATQRQAPNFDYQSVLRNRLNSIDSIAAKPTQDALLSAQQRYANKMMEANNASNIAPNWTGAGGTSNERRQAVLNAAAAQKGMPYSWGGGNARGATEGGANTRSLSGGPVGFDCSGLVQYAYAQAGIKLPRHSDAQLAMGVRAPINKLQPGDLVGKPGHIAIYAGNGMMWESPTFGKAVRLVPVRSGMFGVRINY